MKSFLRLRFVIFALTFSSVFDVLAGNTWTGNGSTPNWSDSNNWGGAAPVYGTLTFSSGGAQGTTSNNNSITAMNQLVWTGSLSWTLNGSVTLSLYDFNGGQAKIENQGTGLITINDPITFAANNSNPPNPFGEINTIGGDITFGSGTLTVNGPSVNGLKSFGSGHVLTFNNTISAPNKWFAMTATSGNRVVVNGSATFADVFVMNGGTLALNGTLSTTGVRLGGDFGTTGQQNLTRGGTFQLSVASGGQTFAGPINSVAGNSSNALLVDVQNTAGTDTLSGAIYCDSPLTIQSAAGGQLNLTGASIDLKSQRLAFNNNGSVTVATAITSSTSGGSLTKSGGGVLLLNGAGSYRGGTTISAGTVRLGVANALPSGFGAVALSGTLDLNGNDQTVVGLNDNGGLTTGSLTNSSTTPATFTLNDSGLDNFAGVISDGGLGKVLKLTKNGSGILTLSGANTYTGETTINGGTLALGAGGSLGSTALGINSGSFSPSEGSSTTGSVTVNTGGTLDLTSGGTGSVGTFMCAALNLNGGTLRFDLANSGFDQLLVSGGPNSVSGTNYISIVPSSGLTNLATGTYTLISAPAGGLTGSYRFVSSSPANVITPNITLTVSGNQYRLWLNSTATALQIVVENAPAKVPVNIMPLGASITEGASADNPYWGGGYRTKLYQYLASDGRNDLHFLGSNTRLFDYNWSGPTNPLITANQLHNEGHFGSTTWQIQNNLNGYDNSNANGSNNGGYWLAPGNGVNPNYVVLNVGGNDYVSNPNDPFVVDRLNGIIDTINFLRPGATVIVSNLAWRQQVGPSINSRYNPYIPGMVYAQVLKGNHVQFVDMYGVMSPNDSTANLSSDLIHPSQGGYNLMADTWWKSFAYGAAFWTGAVDANWNTIQPNGLTNWARDWTRLADRQALLDSGTDVFFNANSSPLSTTLSADVSIRGLNFAAGASAPVTINGSNTVTLNNGGMTVQAGTAAHVINAPVSLGADQTWSNVSSNPLTVNGVLSGSRALKIVGPAFFNFGGANTNSGDIGIDSGGLYLSETGNLSGQGFVYLGNGGSAGANLNASLLANNTSAPISNAIVTNKADTGSAIGSGTRTIGGTNAFGTVTLSGAIYLNGGAVLSSNAGGTTAFTNSIANGSDTGNVSRAITIGGSGIVLLDGNNSYTGGTSVNSGALELGANGTLPGGFIFVGNGGSAFANVNAGLLTAKTFPNGIVTNKADTGVAMGSGTRSIGGANTSGTVSFTGNIYLNGGAVLIEPAGGTVTFNAPIADGSDTGNVSRALTIAGPGTVRLATNNSYTGLTTVSGGTLQLDGSVAGHVVVASGGRLTGTGTINQNLTIYSGGIAQFNGGTFTVNGSVTNNGVLILSNGATIATNSLTNNGTLDLITAGTFTPPANFQNNGIIIDASAVAVAGISNTSGNVTISVISYTGHTYQLQYAPTLTAASFTNVGAPQQGNTGTVLKFGTTIPAPAARGFYRIVVSP